MSMYLIRFIVVRDNTHLALLYNAGKVIRIILDHGYMSRFIWVACTAAQHIRMMNYDLYHLSDKDYELESTENYLASNVILDSEAAITIAKSDEDSKEDKTHFA